jgi:hypothetical protein
VTTTFSIARQIVARRDHRRKFDCAAAIIDFAPRAPAHRTLLDRE